MLIVYRKKLFARWLKKTRLVAGPFMQSAPRVYFTKFLNTVWRMPPLR